MLICIAYVYIQAGSYIPKSCNSQLMDSLSLFIIKLFILRNLFPIIKKGYRYKGMSKGVEKSKDNREKKNMQKISSE